MYSPAAEADTVFPWQALGIVGSVYVPDIAPLERVGVEYIP